MLVAAGVAVALTLEPARPARRAVDAGAALDAGPAADPAVDAGSLEPPSDRPADDVLAFDAGGLTLGLPSGAPRTVRLGIVLVSYLGAEGAGPRARPKAEAAERARRLAEAARTDFRKAVAEGDPGSTEDAGRIPRGVLEPVLEAAVFSLAGQAVSDPIDSPRGFWVVKRLD